MQNTEKKGTEVPDAVVENVSVFPFNVNPEAANAGGLSQAVLAHIGRDAYRHTKSASSVQSVRRVTAGFIGSQRSKWNKSLKADNPNAATRTFADTLKALTNTTAKGDKLAIDKPDIYDLGRKYARCVGYDSLLNEDDISATIMLVLEDYCEGNEHLSFSEISPSDILSIVKEQASA
jgi:hypothetical protein